MIRRPLLALLLLLLLLAACTGEDGTAQDVASTVGPRATVAPGAAMSMLGPGQTAAGATAAADDHADDHHTATALSVGETAAGRVATVDDRDFFVVDLPPGPRAFSLSSFGDVTLVLYASDGITELARSAPGSVELRHDVAQPGPHYLRVQANAGRDLDYNLAVE